MKKLIFIPGFIFVMAFLSLPLGAQEQEETVPPDTTKYVIRDIQYNIDGRTKPFAIANLIELKTGERIGGYQALMAYIARKNQMLRNQRVFEDQPEKTFIDYTLGSQEADGSIPVFLTVYAADSWNFIILPEPKVDSNEGMSLTLKARDYNFLGTMSPLRVDLGYAYDYWDKKQSTFSLAIDSDIPFMALGFRWNFNFDNTFEYNPDNEKHFYYKNTTGLSIDIPWKTTTFTFGFDQSFIVNEEDDDDPEGPFYKDTWYMSSELYAQWKIPLGINVGPFGPLAYTPRVSGIAKYRPGNEGWDVGAYRRGPTVTLGHSIGFGRVDWIGNYRHGLEASLGNTYDYNINQGIHGQYDWSKDGWKSKIEATVAGYWFIEKHFGITSRLKYQQWLFGVDTEAGDVLRGIKNNAFEAENILSFNIDFPIRFIRFVPSEWFENPKLHIFDMEQHWSPFIDMALVNSPAYDMSFNTSDALVTAGLEVIVFSLRWRAVYLRVSAGWNLREFLETKSLPTGSNRELFIGFGHFY